MHSELDLIVKYTLNQSQSKNLLKIVHQADLEQLQAQYTILNDIDENDK